MRRVLLAAAVLSISGCGVLTQSDKAFVANSAAARIYFEDRYERDCVAVKGPVTCEATRQALQDLKHANDVANTVQKLGKVPAPERAEVKALLKKVQLGTQ